MLKNGENKQIDNDAQSSNQKKKWYQKKSVQIAAIIIVGIGVIGSITNPEKETKAKPANVSSSKALSSVLESSTDSPSTPSETSNVSDASESSEELGEISHDEILANDDSIYLYVLKSEKITNILREAIVSFGNQEITSLELYDLAKKAKESQLSFFRGLTSLQNDYNKDYLEACEMYVSNGRELANYLIKYLDKEKIKDLSSAKECLENMDAYTLSVVTQRMTYLSNCGISDEEITEILQKPSPVDEPLVNGE